jgi:hydroxymethylpyrimidine pyrophosphatase-like HAD family hydrolase
MNRKTMNLTIPSNPQFVKLPNLLGSNEIVTEFELSRRRVEDIIEKQPFKFKDPNSELVKENIEFKRQNKILLEKVEKFENTFETEMEDRDEELDQLDLHIVHLKLEKTELETEHLELQAKVKSLEEAVAALQATNDKLTENIKKDDSSGYWFSRYF